MLWTSAELAAATDGTCTGNWQITGLSIDSRTVHPGDLFIAIKGDRLDGHEHAQAALDKGAAAVLVDHAAPQGNHLQVSDTVAALVAIAKAARTRATGKLIAVTGSVGKTTTKEMLAHIAQAQGSAHATYGNLNNHLGLPLTLARLPQDAQVGVFEIGMNHANEIAPLSRLLRPHIALISTIGTAHIENFADGEVGIAHAKGEIFAGLGPDGIAILPADSPLYKVAEDDAKASGVQKFLRFGSSVECDAQLLDCTVHAENTDVTARIGTRTLSYRLPLPGEHMAMNSVAALLAAQAAGLDLDKAIAALLTFAPLKGRGIRKQLAGVTVIDESYNASPLSMIAAIKVLGQCTGRKIAALGDMLELGTTAPTAHASLAQTLQQAGVDKVYCCGPLMQNLWSVLPEALKGAHAPDAKTLAPLVAAAVKTGDTLLVKGSRGQQVEIKGVMSPSMAVIIAAIEAKETSCAA